MAIGTSYPYVPAILEAFKDVVRVAGLPGCVHVAAHLVSGSTRLALEAEIAPVRLLPG